MQRFKLTQQSPVFSSFKDAKGNATFYKKRKARIIHSSDIFIHCILQWQRVYRGERLQQSPLPQATYIPEVETVDWRTNTPWLARVWGSRTLIRCQWKCKTPATLENQLAAPPAFTYRVTI